MLVTASTLGMTSASAWALPGQEQLALQAGATWLEERGVGPELRLGFSHQVGESIDVLAALSSSNHLSSDTTAHYFGGSVGLAYKLDVLEWVPSAGLEFAVYRYHSDGGSHELSGTELAVRPSLGIDRLLGRNWSFGFRVASDVFLTGEPTPLFNNVAGLGQLAYAWGF